MEKLSKSYILPVFFVIGCFFSACMQIGNNSCQMQAGLTRNDLKTSGKVFSSHPALDLQGLKTRV